MGLPDRRMGGLVRGRYWLFVGITAAGMIIGSVVPIVLFGAMTASICVTWRGCGRGG